MNITKLKALHKRVEDMIFDGPVCLTCRDIGGSPTPWPCETMKIISGTQAKDNINVALDHLDQAIIALSHIVVNQCPGYNDLDYKYINILINCHHETIRLRKKLEGKYE